MASPKKEKESETTSTSTSAELTVKGDGSPAPNNGGTEPIGRKGVMIVAGQNGKYNVHFSPGQLVTMADVRLMLAALQRGYHKYCYDLKKKGANR